MLLASSCSPSPAAGGGWRGRRRAIEVHDRTVEAARRGPADAGTVLNASGYVTARRRATVSSKVTGGRRGAASRRAWTVRQGQVLARLDPRPPSACSRLAEAELAASRRAVAETSVRLDQATAHRCAAAAALAARASPTEADLDAADAEVDALGRASRWREEQVRVSERQVALRQADLADTVILAPFTGVAISKDAQPGEMISPVSAGGGFTRTGICTIVDMKSLEIEVDVNESYIHRVDGRPAGRGGARRLSRLADPGHVITIIPTADRQKATVQVRIGFDPLDPRILPDMGVKVAFLGAEAGRSRQPAPRRRASCRSQGRRARTDGRDAVVFVVHGTSAAERRAVRSARRATTGCRSCRALARRRARRRASPGAARGRQSASS